MCSTFVVHFYRCCSEKSQPRLPGLDLTLDLWYLAAGKRSNNFVVLLLVTTYYPDFCMLKEKKFRALDRSCKCEIRCSCIFWGFIYCLGNLNI
jgi:hypothetical protein